LESLPWKTLLNEKRTVGDCSQRRAYLHVPASDANQLQREAPPFYESESLSPRSRNSLTAFEVSDSHCSPQEKGITMLKIIDCRPGKCVWCLQETEVVQAEFQDGLSGLLCKKHLWQALKVRCEAKPQTTNAEVHREKRS